MKEKGTSGAKGRGERATEVRHGLRPAEARKEVLAQLDAQRAQFLTDVERAALSLLRRATRPLPGAVSQPLLDAGRRTVRNTTGRLREMTAEDLARAVYGQVEARPVLALASLFGVGVLTGRVLRVAGAELGGAAPAR